MQDGKCLINEIFINVVRHTWVMLVDISTNDFGNPENEDVKWSICYRA
jgi:hypothetical protein